MSEYTTERIEKLRGVPLVHDCASPDPSDDDDGAEGFVMAIADEPNDGDIAYWDAATRKWLPAAPSGGGAALDDLTDVTITSVADGDVLTYDSGSGEWVNAAPTGGGGGGSMIGSAAFSASGGSISGLVVTGVVSGVTRNATGVYTVSFTSAQADANYIVSAIASDDATAATGIYLSGTSANYTTTSFKLQAIIVQATPAGRDPGVVRVGVYR